MKQSVLHKVLESFGESQAKNIIDLTLSSSFIKPKSVIIDSIKDALNDPVIYTYGVGNYESEYKNEIKLYLHEKYGIKLGQDNILPCAGTKQIIGHTLFSLLINDDSVLIPSPGYPAYKNMCEQFKLRFSTYDTTGQSDDIAHQIIDKIESYKPKLIVLNFPCNPTGRCLTTSQYVQIIEKSKEHGVYILHDNILDDFSPNENPISLFSLDIYNDMILELSSFSKMHGMSGLRIGCVYGHQNLLKVIKASRQIFEFNVPALSLHAGICALKNRDDSFKDYIFQNMELVENTFIETNTKYIVPDGGVSILAEIPFDIDSISFCSEFYKYYGVKTLPGIIYGEKHDKYFRVTLMSLQESLHDFDRLYKNYINKIGGKSND
tara:strand:+ start:532 stop:1665 length:1134 start_codon:yes stop_codon:yes gene_type:complete